MQLDSVAFAVQHQPLLACHAPRKVAVSAIPTALRLPKLAQKSIVCTTVVSQISASLLTACHS